MVYRFIIEAQAGKRYEIAKLAKPDSRDKFVDVLKDFIRFGDGKIMGFHIELTSDYMGFVKLPAMPSNK